jgi:hypothetical protein
VIQNHVEFRNCCVVREAIIGRCYSFKPVFKKPDQRMMSSLFQQGMKSEPVIN